MDCAPGRETSSVEGEVGEGSEKGWRSGRRESAMACERNKQLEGSEKAIHGPRGKGHERRKRLGYSSTRSASPLEGEGFEGGEQEAPGNGE